MWFADKNMNKILCLMGKSASGKDTIYKRLIEDKSLGLERIIPYTTRPIRENEVDGVEYHFVSEDEYNALRQNGLILEERAYDTVHGLWRYFTVDDGIHNDSSSSDGNMFLLIGTLEAYVSLCKSLGNERIIPIYIEIDDGVRLERALMRERTQDVPKYTEMCRRFLADAEDFSEDKLRAAGIETRFDNSNLTKCIEEVREYIIKQK